jgi:hypothetical protein
MAGKDLGDLTAKLVSWNMSDGLNRWEKFPSHFSI